MSVGYSDNFTVQCVVRLQNYFTVCTVAYAKASHIDRKSGGTVCSRLNFQIFVRKKRGDMSKFMRKAMIQIMAKPLAL